MAKRMIVEYQEISPELLERVEAVAKRLYETNPEFREIMESGAFNDSNLPLIEKSVKRGWKRLFRMKK